MIVVFYMVKKAVKIVVKGTVQGVFFRRFCEDKARDFKIKGFVRNLDSGDVEIVAEGEGENLERFVRQIQQGPPHAQIRNVNVEERKWSGDFEDFRVLRF